MPQHSLSLSLSWASSLPPSLSFILSLPAQTRLLSSRATLQKLFRLDWSSKKKKKTQFAAIANATTKTIDQLVNETTLSKSLRVVTFLLSRSLAWRSRWLDLMSTTPNPLVTDVAFLIRSPFVLRFSYDTRPFSYAFPTNYSLCWVTYLNYQSFSFFFNTFGLFYKTLEQKEDLGWNNSETNYNITTLSVALKWTYSVHFGEDPDKNELKLTIVYRTIVSAIYYSLYSIL